MSTREHDGRPGSKQAIKHPGANRAGGIPTGHPAAVTDAIAEISIGRDPVFWVAALLLTVVVIAAFGAGPAPGLRRLGRLAKFPEQP